MFKQVASNAKIKRICREENIHNFSGVNRTFHGNGRDEKLVQTRETISTTKIFPLWPPFLSAKFLIGAGWCMVWFSQICHTHWWCIESCSGEARKRLQEHNTQSGSMMYPKSSVSQARHVECTSLTLLIVFASFYDSSQDT